MASDWIRGNSKRRIVLLDTSALFMSFEHTLDVEKELVRLLGSYEIQIIRKVFDELHILKEKGSGKQQLLAKTALSFIKRYNVVEGISAGNADESLLATAQQLSAVVVTNDKELRRKLKKNGVQTICLRGKNYLMME